MRLKNVPPPKQDWISEDYNGRRVFGLRVIHIGMEPNWMTRQWFRWHVLLPYAILMLGMVIWLGVLL